MDQKVFLTSTDTTIGFLSKSKDSLDKAKNRASNKYYIKAFPLLKDIPQRIPKKYKNLVRRAKKSTFIVNKKSFRVVKDKRHLLLLNRLGWAYTTSANRSNEEYNYKYAFDNASIIIYPLIKSTPSKIFKLGKNRLKRLR